MAYANYTVTQAFTRDGVPLAVNEEIVLSDSEGEMYCQQRKLRIERFLDPEDVDDALLITTIEAADALKHAEAVAASEARDEQKDAELKAADEE